MKNNKLIHYFAFIFLFLFSMSFLTACDQRESSRQLNPDSNPPVVDNDDDPISTPADSDPVVGDDTPGGGTPAGGSGGVPPPPPPIDDPTPPATGTGIIRGSVVSSATAPLNGVHVRAVNINDTNVQISSFSGIDCDLVLSDGLFCIQNIPAGTYRVLIESFLPGAYSPFIQMERTNLVFPDEYWNGANESDTDDVMEIETVVVANGATVNGINFITND